MDLIISNNFALLYNKAELFCHFLPFYKNSQKDKYSKRGLKGSDIFFLSAESQKGINAVQTMFCWKAEGRPNKVIKAKV